MDNEPIVIKVGDPENLLPDLLKKYSNEREKVSVWTGVNDKRHSFDAGISVCGILEQQHEFPERFRVVVNSGTYAYFQIKDIELLTAHPKRFQDGSKAVITLSIKPEK